MHSFPRFPAPKCPRNVTRVCTAVLQRFLRNFPKCITCSMLGHRLGKTLCSIHSYSKVAKNRAPPSGSRADLHCIIYDPTCSSFNKIQSEVNISVGISKYWSLLGQPKTPSRARRRRRSLRTVGSWNHWSTRSNATQTRLSPEVDPVGHGRAEPRPDPFAPGGDAPPI